MQMAGHMRAAVAWMAMTGVLLLAPGIGRAECLPDDQHADPPLPQPGGTVICTGSDPDGFIRTHIDNLSVVVRSGANVAGIINNDASGPRVTVASGGRVRSPGVPDSAINLQSTGGGIISNAGQVDSTGSVTPAILASGSNLTIDNSGSIQTGGNESSGIEIPSISVANITNSGQIVTTGDEAKGIDVLGSGISIENTGTIQTFGLESAAIDLEGTGGSINVVNAGNLTTGGFAAPGVLIESAGAVVENRGSVTTAGWLSPGLGAIGGDGGLSNSGTIATTGADASGIQVGVAFLGSSELSSANVLSNSGSIDVRGEDSHGLFAIGHSNNLTNAAAGTIDASGTGSSGLQVGVSTPGLEVEANGNVLRNFGTITSAGTNGHGMHAAGENNDLENSGTIRIDGSEGNGLSASGPSNSLTNALNGEIFVRGDAQEGMRYEGDSGSARNRGLIDASATGADGISMFGDSLLQANNTGRITVTGGGTGIAVRGSNGSAFNLRAFLPDSGIITTTAASSAGIWMLETGRIVNTGEVQTFGTDSSGLVVSGDSGGGLARVTNDGSVSTIGSGSYGIEVGRSQAATSGRINLTGSIATEGSGADGIHVSAESYEVVIGATGGIVTSGAGADGVAMRGGDNTLDNEGVIQVQGAGAAGVRLETTGSFQAFFNSGDVTSSGDAVLGSDGGELVFNSGTISGDIRLAGGNDFLTLTEGSAFTGLADGGSGLVDELEVDIDSIDTLAGGQFVNFETFRKTGTGLLIVQDTLSVDLALVERGSLAIALGSTLRADVGVTVGSNGTLVGSGTIDGDIVVDPGGFLAPGLSLGTLSITKDLVLEGIMKIEVGSAFAGGSDLVRVLGQADLGSGQILLSFIDDYVPEIGDAFAFLIAGSLLGLDQVGLEYSGLPPGYDFSLSSGGSGLIASTTAVPEPSSLSLVLLGTLILGAYRRGAKRRLER